MGKEEAFVHTIKEYEGMIFKITTIYTNNQYDQKDLYQEIVYQLWKSFDSYRKEAKISTWLYRVALNTALVQLRKQKRRAEALPIDQVVLHVTDQHDPVFETQLKRLYTQIGKLDILEKGIILLFLEGKKYEEIGEILGLSTTNVGTRLSRIKSKLKERIIK